MFYSLQHFSCRYDSWAEWIESAKTLDVFFSIPTNSCSVRWLQSLCSFKNSVNWLRLEWMVVFQSRNILILSNILRWYQCREIFHELRTRFCFLLGCCAQLFNRWKSCVCLNFPVIVVYSLIAESCFIKCSVYFTADLAVTCATDFHEKRYEHLDKYAFHSKKCDKSSDDAC